MLAHYTDVSLYLWLYSMTPSGDELLLEIPVQVVWEQRDTICKLAVQKVLQELKEGTRYIHNGKYGVDEMLTPGMPDDQMQTCPCPEWTPSKHCSLPSPYPFLLLSCSARFLHQPFTMYLLLSYQYFVLLKSIEFAFLLLFLLELIKN